MSFGCFCEKPVMSLWKLVFIIQSVTLIIVDYFYTRPVSKKQWDFYIFVYEQS